MTQQAIAATDSVLDFDLDELEARLVSTALDAPRDLALPSGMAGVLTMSARMYQLYPTRARAERAARMVEHLVDWIGSCSLHSGLWAGLAGILYAFEYARSVDPVLLGEHLDTVAEFVEEMDDVLVHFLGREPYEHRFDLISGQCGLGAYALMRTDVTAARRLFAAAEQALLDVAARDGTKGCWRTQPRHVADRGSEQQKRDGRFDLGVAHGSPGVIGLLAHGLRLGIATERSAALLDDCLQWLKAQEDSTLKFSRFQVMLNASDPPAPPKWSRLAWCYGDLGVAAMLASAADSRQDPGLAQWWRALAEFRIGQPATSYLIADHGLCHGAAGVLHIIRSLQAHGFESAAAARLASEYETTLADAARALGQVEKYGLLEGWAGILLALVESRAEDRAPGRPWNLCLLTPA